MVGLLFHVLYFLGKCIYNRFRVKRSIILPDVPDEADLFKFDFDCDNCTFDDVTELENTSWWIHGKVNNFFPPAYIQRYCAVSDVLSEYEGKMYKIVDFGCGELNFLVYLKPIPEVEQILCVDVDREVLERYEKKAEPLITEMLSTRQRKLTIEICKGSVTDNDVKLKDVNAVICIELIEHLYPDTLTDLPFNIFGYIKPDVAIITTPNVEFNVVFPNLSGYRHSDHKFEWTREQFQDWAQNIVVRYPYYSVTFHGVCNGPDGSAELGALTQMAVFRRILPRNKSSTEILTADEYFRLNGQVLFDTVAKYVYPTGHDTRSDEQKILDEATYYINYLSYNINDNEESRNDEICLNRILYFMTKYTITVELLKSILIDAQWNVVDRENGPVVLVPSEESSDGMSSYGNDVVGMADDFDNDYEISRDEQFDSTYTENIFDYVAESSIDEVPIDANEEYIYQQNPRTENWYEESNAISEDRWDYVTRSPIDEIPTVANEEHLSQQNHIENWHDNSNFTDEMNSWDESGQSTSQIITNEEHSYVQNPRVENWHEEPSIIIPENCVINQENTYLFDGENSLVEDFQPSKEPHSTHDGIKHSKVRNTAKCLVYTERELPSDSVSLTLNEIEMKLQVTASNLSSATLVNSSQLKNSVNNVTTEQALLENDQMNPRTTQSASMLNFQPHMSISRSSTSPASLCFNSEMNNSLQEFNTYYQNESSMSNQCLLNSTFCQSEIATSTEESTADNESCLEESLLAKDTQVSEINLPLHMPLNYDYNMEQRDISDKNQICEDNDMSSETYSSFNNRPKYTSSPHTKMSITNVVNKSLKHSELMLAMNSNVLLNTTEEIEEPISDTTSSNSLKASQKSNITKTSELCATSSSNDTSNTSKHNVGFFANDSTQQKLCLENNEFSAVDSSISTELIQDTNQKFAENNIISHKPAMDDMRKISSVTRLDTHHVLSLGDESTNHKSKDVYCTLAKRDLTDTDAKAHFENVISDLTQTNVRRNSLNPPKELVSSKSQSVNKYSPSDCAKEASVLRNDRFVSCKSSENTNNVHFTSSLKNEETVGTSKDVSNIGRLMNNIEAKPSSPLETPPNSWSPEIMDSGYPNSASAQDITPEYELPSIAQDYIPDSESPSVAEAPRLGVLEPIEVENGDLANNNRDDEGNNMMAVDANDIENLQPFIDVLENDLENENDIYVVQNGFPVWLLRILDMANPIDFDMQGRQNLIIPDEVADDANYVGHDEGFDSSSSESESDVAYNEMENDNRHGE